MFGRYVSDPVGAPAPALRCPALAPRCAAHGSDDPQAAADAWGVCTDACNADFGHLETSLSLRKLTLEIIKPMFEFERILLTK